MWLVASNNKLRHDMHNNPQLSQFLVKSTGVLLLFLYSMYWWWRFQLSPIWWSCGDDVCSSLCWVCMLCFDTSGFWDWISREHAWMLRLLDLLHMAWVQTWKSIITMINKQHGHLLLICRGWMLTAWLQHFSLLNAMWLTLKRDKFVPNNIFSDFTVGENWEVGAQHDCTSTRWNNGSPIPCGSAGWGFLQSL